MSSTHRFESRLFQTLQSKLHQVQDSLGLRWRQLKTTAVWNAQLTLFPFHAAFRAGRWSRQALSHHVKERLRLITAALAQESKVDQPIHNVLSVLNSQNDLRTPNSPDQQSLVQSAPKQITLQTRPKPLRQALSFASKCSELWHKLRGRPQTETVEPVHADLQQPSTLNIQGVASALHDQHLVLISTSNQVLDILTAEQQSLLHQRISFELAAMMRRKRRFNPNLPKLTQRLKRLKTGWRQILGTVPKIFLPKVGTAILPAVEVLETSEHPWTHQLLPRLQSWRSAFLTGISAIAVAPFAGVLPASATATPIIPVRPLPAPWVTEWMVPARTRRQWLKGLDLFGQSKPTQGKVRLAPEKAPALSAEQFQSALTDWAYRSAQAIPSLGSPPIDVSAAFVGYHYGFLERLLIVLDQMMAWLEHQVLWLWQRGLSIIRKVIA